jgi:hypothetical protein
MYYLMYYCVKWHLPASSVLATLLPMPRKSSAKDMGTLNIRDVPKDLLYLVKLAATVERRTIKGFLLALAEERIQELEKKGLLPKGKG